MAGRWTRELLRWLAALLVVLALGLALALVALRTPWGTARIEATLHDTVQDMLAPGWTFERARVWWGFGGRLVVQGVRVTDPDGETAVAIARLDVDLDVSRLLIGTVRLESAVVEDVVVALSLDDQGVLNLVNAFGGPVEPGPEPEEAWGGLPFPLIVDDLAVRDARVGLWGPGDAGELEPRFVVNVLALDADRARMPRREAAVYLTGADVAAVLLEPGPLPLLVDGDVAWTGTGIAAEGFRVRTLNTDVAMTGHLDDLDGAGDAEVTLAVGRLDLGVARLVAPSDLQGVLEGELRARGPLGGLALEGRLQGVGDTTGAVTLHEGTMVCLPVPEPTRDLCAVPLGEDPPPGQPLPTFGPGDPLRWRAWVDVDGLDVIDLVPSLGGPLVLSTEVRARGRGTTWPDDVWVDGHLEGGRLDVFGVVVRRHALDVALEDGTLRFWDADVTAVAGTVRGGGSLDLVDGDLEVTATGDLDLDLLEDLGVPQLGGTGTFSATVTGNVFAAGAPISVRGRADAGPLTWEDDIRVGTLRGPFEVRVVDGVVDVAADVQTTAVLAYGVAGDALDADRLRLRVVPRDEGAEVDLSAAALRASGVDGYGVAAARVVAERLDVDVAPSGRVGVTTGGVGLGAIEGYGLTAEEARLGALTVAVAPDGSVGVTAPGARLEGVRTDDLSAEGAVVGPLDVRVSPDGAVEGTAAGAGLTGARAPGVSAEGLDAGALQIRTAPGGDVRISAEGARATGARAGDEVGAEALDAGTVRVDISPGGEVRIEADDARATGGDVGPIRAEGADVSGVGVRVRPDGEVEVEAQGARVTGVDAEGVEAEGVSSGAVDVRVSPGGEVRVDAGDAEVTGATVGGVRAEDADLTDVEVRVSPGGEVEAGASGARVTGLSGEGVEAEGATTGAVEVQVTPGGEVRVGAGAARVTGVEAEGVEAEGVSSGAVDVRVSPGGEVRVDAGDAEVTGATVGGVRADDADLTDVEVRVSPGGEVEAGASGARVTGVSGEGVEAEGATTGAVEVQVTPGGEVRVGAGAARVTGVEAEGVRAGEAATGPVDVRVGPDGAVEVDAGTVRVRGVEDGVTVDAAALEGVEVEVAPDGAVEVRAEDAVGAGVTGAGVRSGQARVQGVQVQVVPEGRVQAAASAASLLGGPADAATTGHLEVEVTPEGQVSVSVGGVALQGIEAYGARVEQALVERVDVSVTPEGATRVEGVAQVPLLRYPGVEGVFHDVDATFDVRVDEAGVVALDARASLGAHEILGLPGDAGLVAVAMRDDVVGLDASLSRDDEPWVVVDDLRLDTTTQRLGIEALLVQPTWRQRWVSQRPIRLTLTDTGVADADVLIASDQGTVLVEGTLQAEGALSGRVVLDHVDLDVLAELLPDVVGGVDGVVTLELLATGTAEDPALAASIDADGLFVEDAVRWLDVRGRITLLDDTLDVALDVGVGDEELARVIGYAPVEADLTTFQLIPEGRADLQVIVQPGELARFERLVPGLSLPQGDVSAVVAVEGDLRDPDVALQGVVDLASVRGVALRGEVDVLRRGSRLDLALDLYDGFDPVLLLTGSADTRVGEITDWLLGGEPPPALDDPSLYVDDVQLEAVLDDLPLAMVRRLLDLDVDLGGALSGTLALSGDPLQPVVTADVDGTLALADVEAPVSLELQPTGDAYALDLALGSEADRWLVARGTVPLRIDLSTPPETWATTTYDLTVGGDGIPLAILRAFDPGFQVEGGRILVGGTVGGRLYEPLPQLQLGLNQADFTYLPLGLRFRDLVVDASVDARADGRLLVDVRRLATSTRPAGVTLGALTQPADSQIVAAGSVLLNGLVPTRIDGGLHLDNAWLIAGDRTQLRASGGVEVSGTWPALVVFGDLAVDQGLLTLNTAELAAPGDIEVAPDLLIYRGGDLFRRAEPEVDEESFFEEVDLQVELDLGRNTNLDLQVPLLEDLGAFASNVTRAEVVARLGGTLTARLRNGRLSLVGTVEALEGTVDLLRGRFALESGSSITFIGEDYTNPQLDIQGAMSVGGGEIRLTLSGPAQAPTVDLASSDFGSDAAIFTILLTGRAPEELTADQGLAAIEAASDLLLTSVLGGVNLGSVNVEADGTVTLGVPVYRTVFLESSYDPTARLDENTITVELEWNILPRLLLEAAYGDRRVFGNLMYELRLTTLCDTLRDAYRRLPDVRGRDAVAASCREIRRRVREEGGVEAIEEAWRQRRRQMATPPGPPEIRFEADATRSPGAAPQVEGEGVPDVQQEQAGEEPAGDGRGP